VGDSEAFHLTDPLLLLGACSPFALWVLAVCRLGGHVTA
jgi:hypothetical protein